MSPIYNPARQSKPAQPTEVKRPEIHYFEYCEDGAYLVPEADAYIDSIERQALFTIAELNKRDAMRVERIRELEKEVSTLSDELFDMCKLVHRYQNHAWAKDKAALNAQPTKEGE